MLRAVEPDDARAIWVMENDASQWVANGMMAPFSMANILQYATEYDPDPFHAGQLRLIATSKDPSGDWNEDNIGIIDLYNISARNHTAFVGIYVRPRFRGSKYAPEMLEIIERYAAEVLCLRSLAVKVMNDNLSSMALFSNHGYRQAGALIDWARHDNHYASLIIFQKCLNT